MRHSRYHRHPGKRATAYRYDDWLIVCVILLMDAISIEITCAPMIHEFSLYTGIIAACVSPLAFMMCRKWLMFVILPVSIIAAAVSIYAAV